MFWVDPDDASVFAAVAGVPLDEDTPDEVREDVRNAVRIAGDILTPLTAYAVHPAGIHTEEFRCGPTTVMLTPLIRPMREVLSLTRTDLATSVVAPFSDYLIAQGSVHMRRPRSGVRYRTVGDVALGNPCCQDDTSIYTLTYRVGSTVTAAARNALLIFARQLYLVLTDDDDCALPERTTSVTREGISIDVMNPQDFLENGKIGLPRVDLWLASVNMAKATRPSGVWAPEMPPGVHMSGRRIP